MHHAVTNLDASKITFEVSITNNKQHMVSEDPYKVLGVEKIATQNDIRAAYLKHAKKYHPDLHPGNKHAEKKFKEINNANEILSNPEKRALFDSGQIDAEGNQNQQTSSAQQEPPFYYETQQNGGRYNDIFEQFFQSEHQSQRKKPVDKHYTLEVDFIAAAIGAEQEIKLPDGKSIKVKIPAGITSGQKLRLKGQGEVGNTSGKASDAYIEILVKPSSLFSRDANSILMELPISLSEAVLGAEIKIPTVDNHVMLKIPAGASTGMKLRVKGKGIGAIGSKTRGDFIVTLKVVMPPHIDPELHDMIRAWSLTHSYNPRENIEREGEKNHVG